MIIDAVELSMEGFVRNRATPSPEWMARAVASVYLSLAEGKPPADTAKLADIVTDPGIEDKRRRIEAAFPDRVATPYDQAKESP